MWFLSGILLAVSLSMDALGIGISYGLRNVKVPIVPKFIISLISVLFTGLAVGIGNIILLVLPADIAKLMGSVMLGILGIFIIYQSLHKDNEYTKNSTRTWSMVLKSFGITIKIIRDPISCDFDKSSHIDVKEAIYLGVALSIDSFGAGISSAVSGINSFFVPVMVGICQFLFLSLGLLFGVKLSSLKWFNSKFFVTLSGVMLIILSGIRYFC